MLSSCFTIEMEHRHELGETKCNRRGENNGNAKKKVLQTLLVFKFLKGLAGLKGGWSFLSLKGNLFGRCKYNCNEGMKKKVVEALRRESSSVIKLLCATSAFLTCEDVPNYYLQFLLCNHLMWRIKYKYFLPL